MKDAGRRGLMESWEVQPSKLAMKSFGRFVACACGVFLGLETSPAMLDPAYPDASPPAARAPVPINALVSTTAIP